MTVWKGAGDWTAEERALYNGKYFLRYLPTLMASGTSFWGPNGKALKDKLPDLFKSTNFTDSPESIPEASAFAPNSTIWVLDGPDKGIWGLNVTSVGAAQAALQKQFPVQDGWYVRLAEVPFPETLYKSGLKKYLAQDNWGVYNNTLGKSIDEITAEQTEADKKIAADRTAAQADYKRRTDQSEIDKIKNAPPGSIAPPGSTPPGSTPASGTWLAPDTTYELVALQGSSPVPVDVAFRAARNYQWKLTDDPNAGYHLAGKPGAGGYLSRGQPPSSFGLPAYVVGQGQGAAGVISAAALTTLFGPDWAKP